jgi:RNA polymerase sigma-70 factor (ECF subfamily)
VPPKVSASLRASLIQEMASLRAFAVSLCGDKDRADDLVQETLFKAWNHLDSFREGTNLKAWLFTILRNTYFSERRKRKREVEDADGSYAANLATPPEQPGHMDMQDFLSALSRLPDDQREALVLIGAAGFSYEEAAEISNCAVGTIKSRVNRARNRLVEALGLNEDELKLPAEVGITVARDVKRA